MKYQRMKFHKILAELDSEEKARLWVMNFTFCKASQTRDQIEVAYF